MPVCVIGRLLIAIHAQTRSRSVQHAVVLNFPNQPAYRKHAVGEFFSIWKIPPNQPAFGKHAVGDFFSAWRFSPNQPAFTKFAVIGKILGILSWELCIRETESVHMNKIVKAGYTSLCNKLQEQGNLRTKRRSVMAGKNYQSDEQKNKQTNYTGSNQTNKETASNSKMKNSQKNSQKNSSSNSTDCY